MISVTIVFLKCTNKLNRKKKYCTSSSGSFLQFLVCFNHEGWWILANAFSAFAEKAFGLSGVVLLRWSIVVVLHQPRVRGLESYLPCWSVISFSCDIFGFDVWAKTALQNKLGKCSLLLTCFSTGIDPVLLYWVTSLALFIFYFEIVLLTC